MASQLHLTVTLALSEDTADVSLDGLDITVAQMDAALRGALHGTGRDIPAHWQSRAGVGSRGFLRAGIVRDLLTDQESREYHRAHGRYAIMYAPDDGDDDGLQTQYDVLNDAVSLHDFDLLTPSISSHALHMATYALRRESAGDEVIGPLPWSKLLLAERKLIERCERGEAAGTGGTASAGTGNAALPQTMDALAACHDEPVKPHPAPMPAAEPASVAPPLSERLRLACARDKLHRGECVKAVA